MEAKYIKSFSHGQITIPKEFRDHLGMEGEFWLKLSVNNHKIIAEPIGKKLDKQAWRKKLLQMPQIDIDPMEIQRNRDEIEERLRRNAL